MMLRSHRLFVPLVAVATTLASLASAQAGSQLSLATVLAGGAGLSAPQPRVDWRPDGHAATVVLTDDQRFARLFELVDGRPQGEPLCQASDVYLAMGLDVTGRPVPFVPFTWLDDDTMRIEFRGAIWHWQLGENEATQVLSWPQPDLDASAFREPVHSVAPGDAHVAVRKDRNMWLVDKDGDKRQVTHDGSDDIVIGGAAHRAELGIQSGMFWSGKGRYLAFTREDLRPIAVYPYQNVAETQPTPRHGRYPMAGKPHSKVTVGIVDTTDYRVTYLEHDPDADIYWTNIGFDDAGHVLVAQVNRGQDHMELVQFDVDTGRKLRVLLREHDTEWIEPEHAPTFLKDGRFLWWSRRTGYRHLWMCSADGEVLHQITKGDMDVQSLLRVSNDETHLFFEAAGDDARQLHLFRAELNGKGVTQLTKERGTHHASLSPDGTMAAVSWSNLETRPQGRIVDLQSGAITELPTAHDPLADFELPKQRFFEVKADDGTVLYGHVALPPNVDEGGKRPVIHYVYGGPHAQLVKDEWLGGASLWLQALAAEGFVVSRLDNRGTPNRGIEFEQAIHRQLGTLEVKDQMKAIEWLKQQPYADGDRIGVHGWSFGGYMTLRLMLLLPETFACGISGAPVTDWAMYETGYGERYMDTPEENPEGYEASSCLPIAGALQRPLLLVHGTDDRTVMWSHTLQFVDACVKAGVHLDYFPYPMQRHGLGGPYRVHFMQRLRRFFMRHLRPEERT